MTQVDILVVGAGVWGCTLARVFAEAGRKVLVLEKRSVIGGNVRCETDAETGIEVHSYGSHIFHTHNEDVWKFVNRFVSFNGYQHKVLAHYKEKTYFLPLGLTLVNQFYGLDLKPCEVSNFIAKEVSSSSLNGSLPSNLEEQAISFVGRRLYEAFIKGYTEKQWGCDARKLDPAIIRRLPVRTSYDVNYFQDYCQGIPLDGYNVLFERMIDHPNITVECNVDWLKVRESYPNVLTFYSGPIDALFDYKFGSLPWRSLRFETERLLLRDYQGTSVVNYTERDVPWTRIHEFKHYHPERVDIMALEQTIICKEYPKTWTVGDEPYYAVNTPESSSLLVRYQEEARKHANLVIGGRLGAYKYFDIDQSIAMALEVAKHYV